MARNITVMVCWQIDTPVNALMVRAVNSVYGCDLPTGSTFRDFYNVRDKFRGYLRKKDGVDVWIVPMFEHGFVSNDATIAEFMSVEDYEKIEFDPVDIE